MNRRTFFLSAALAAATLSVGFLSNAPAEQSRARTLPSEPKVIRFTAIPDRDESAIRERVKPFADYLTEKLGVKFEYFHCVDYAASVKALEKEDAYLGWYGGFTGLQVRKRTKGMAIAQGEEDKAFYSYFIAHKSTGLKESKDFPKDIAKKTFTFGAESSTSGRLMPEFFIREAFGKAPAEIFEKVGFSGSHPNTLAFVKANTWQVGAINGNDWDKAVAEQTTGDAIAIWKSPTYQDYNWTVRGNIDEVYGKGFAEKLKAAILAIDPSKSEKDAAIMKAFSRKRFIEAKNEDYKALEKVATDIGLLK